MSVYSGRACAACGWNERERERTDACGICGAPMERARLVDAGHVYVTAAAAKKAAAQMHAAGLPRGHWGEESARRALTEALLDARMTHAATGGKPAKYRSRSRSSQLDVTASVVVEGRLAVVVAVSVRDYL